jgi:hypothetical protein
MLDFVIAELADNHGWRRILETYQHRDLERRKTEPASDGWQPRLAEVPGVERGDLAGLHGKLIALGFLKFELHAKNGMQYQVSPLGRQTLERGLSDELETDSGGDSRAPEGPSAEAA